VKVLVFHRLSTQYTLLLLTTSHLNLKSAKVSFLRCWTRLIRTCGWLKLNQLR